MRDLYKRLRADGFDPWLDEVDILPGQDWELAIPEAVSAADVVLVCLSRDSINKKGYVQKEIKYALDVADEQPEGTIYLIPVKLEECDIPARLRRWQWVNLFTANGYEQLLSALRYRAGSISINRKTDGDLPEKEVKLPGIQTKGEAPGKAPLKTNTIRSILLWLVGIGVAIGLLIILSRIVSIKLSNPNGSSRLNPAPITVTPSPAGTPLLPTPSSAGKINNAGETRPIIKENLIASLQANGRLRIELNAGRYVQLIEQHGVSFRLTVDDERAIRQAGNYLSKTELDNLITAVRDNYREP